MRPSNPEVWLAPLLAVVTASASAQVKVVARDSQLRVDWLAGYTDDLYGGGGSDSDGNLMAIDGASLTGNDSAEDDYPPTGVFWRAEVFWELRHAYTIEGSPSALDDAMRLSATGSTAVSSFVSGPASVSVNGNLPGNLLALTFINPVEQRFLFEGGVSQSGPENRNRSWVQILDDRGVPTVVGTGAYNDTWLKEVTLPAGIYTLVGSAVAVAGPNDSTASSWSYSLAVLPAVPEPGTAALWLAAGLPLAWWCRRRRMPAIAA